MRVPAGHGEQRAGHWAHAMAVRAHELGFSRPCRPGSHLAAARGQVWVGGYDRDCAVVRVRYACADDGVTIA